MIEAHQNPTPTQIRYISEAKQRRARMAAQAIRPAPPPPLPIETPEQWAARQLANHQPIHMDERVRISDIQRACAQHYGISQDDILSDRILRKIARPRQVGYYLAKQLTRKSLPEIARLFGGRDHTAAIHGIRKIELLLKTDSQLASDIEAIKQILARRQ